MSMIQTDNLIFEYIRRDEEGNVESITKAIPMTLLCKTTNCYPFQSAKLHLVVLYPFFPMPSIESCILEKFFSDPG